MSDSHARDGRASGHAALLAVQGIFGLFPVFGLLAMQPEVGFAPFAVAAWRVTAGALVIGGLAWWLHGRRCVPARADLLRLVALAQLGIVANQLLYLSGLERSTATNAGLMICLVPVFTFVVAAAIRQERLEWVRAVGVLFALVGVLPLVLGEGASLLGEHALGNALLAANGLCYALYLVFSKPLLRRYPPIVVLAWCYVLSVPALPIFLAGRSVLPADPGDGKVWASLAYVLIGPTIVAYFLNIFALERLRASTTAAYILLQPVLAACAGAWILGEQLTPSVLLSGAALCVGLWLVARRPAAVSAPRPSPRTP